MHRWAAGGRVVNGKNTFIFLWTFSRPMALSSLFITNTVSLAVAPEAVAEVKALAEKAKIGSNDSRL